MRMFHLELGEGTLRTVVCHPDGAYMMESDGEWVSPRDAILTRPEAWRPMSIETEAALMREELFSPGWYPGEWATVFVPDSPTHPAIP